MATESILTSTKKVLGITEDYEEFDQDILMYINSAFATLNQLAVGPENSLYIVDKAAVWEDLIQGEPNINSVRAYVAMKVRLAFDPPATSFHITSLENQIKEYEWRLNVVMENVLRPSSQPTPDGTRDNPWNLTGGLDFPSQAQSGDYGIDLESGDVWRKE